MMYDVEVKGECHYHNLYEKWEKCLQVMNKNQRLKLFMFSTSDFLVTLIFFT